jgi:hypothetical protein
MAFETLERRLGDDLRDMQERLADEKFCEALYRSITRIQLLNPETGDGHLTLSYGQAEGMINELRAQIGGAPLTLAQTGGEGEPHDPAARELARRGWSFAPLETGRHDPMHDSAGRQPPTDHTAERRDSGRWAREAHAEADREVRRKTP